MAGSLKPTHVGFQPVPAPAVESSSPVFCDACSCGEAGPQAAQRARGRRGSGEGAEGLGGVRGAMQRQFHPVLSM